MPTSETLTTERILEATEDVLRRYGPAKATVVDVARLLGVSHGSVYRHFRTKAALREAVTARWLGRTEDLLAEITEAPAPSAGEKLRHWLSALFEAKRHKAGDDPELFATYSALITESSDTVDRHLALLTGQLTSIVEEGVAAGEFTARVARLGGAGGVRRDGPLPRPRARGGVAQTGHRGRIPRGVRPVAAGTAPLRPAEVRPDASRPTGRRSPDGPRRGAPRP